AVREVQGRLGAGGGASNRVGRRPGGPVRARNAVGVAASTAGGVCRGRYDVDAADGPSVVRTRGNRRTEQGKESQEREQCNQGSHGVPPSRPSGTVGSRDVGACRPGS